MDAASAAGPLRPVCEISIGIALDMQEAMAIVSTHFNSKQQVFLDFVLSHYVSIGVEELDQAKLTPLLRLKYHDLIADAVADLGRPDEIGRVFCGFQKCLCQKRHERQRPFCNLASIGIARSILYHAVAITQ